MIKPRTYSVPQSLEDKINEVLENQFSISLDDHKAIAECIEALSEHYIRLPGTKTPWKEDWCQIAYLAYYLPLNEIRARAVIEEGQKFHFFDHIDEVTDFGSGLGSSTFNLKFENQIHIEDSLIAQKLHQQLGGNGKWSTSFQKTSTNSLLSMSYSLTELEEIPSWFFNFQSLMIIEPATHAQGRKLLQLREQLIEKGYFIWAPCTHQKKCPLLHQSKTDWCHDRVHFDQNSWFSKIETHLPIRNSTLTFSYLLARRTKPPHTENMARTTGDMLPEKGKTRQLICRDENREFLAWMHKNTDPQEIPRGTLIEWPTEFTLKSNEVRVNGRIHPYQF